MFCNQQLPNGLTIIGEATPSARSVAIGFFVRTGSRDETPEEAGLSHYLEHMVFKGTPRRSALDVNKDFDRIGANYNAFTSEENTVFYAAVLPEYLPQACDILADILRPSLRDDDFNMEKNVIIEEIGMYDDQPNWAAFDNAKRHFFRDHPLGPAVLGTADSIKAMTRDRMHDYFKRRYVAPNVTVVATGNFEWERLIELVDKACGSWETGAIGRNNIRPAVGPGTLKTVTKEKVMQEHVVMIAPAPAANSPMRHAADLLAMAVGDDSGSRLYWELVDPGHSDSADTSFHEYEGTGVYYTSFTGEPANASGNLARVRQVLTEVQAKGITAEELQQAKSKVLSRVVRSSERPMGRMQALGMAWTYLGVYRSVDDELNAFEAVKLDGIRQVLDAFPINNATVLALGPLETVND
jgi:predicted Zn-dependent peptidase